jgi:ribose transport system substrate-binding protein
MKKRMAIVLCIVMLVAVFTACSGSTDSGSTASSSGSCTAAQTESEGNAASTASGDRIKIGVDFFDYAIPIGVDVKRMLDHAAESLDCDIEYSSNNFDTEKVVTNVENLFASGCDAVIICNSAEGQVQAGVVVAENYDGKLFQFFRTLSDPEVSEEAWASAGYGGQVHEDEYSVGYNLGTAMAEKGCKNVGLINFNRSDLTAQTRQQGYEDAFAELGVNIVAETWDISTGEGGAQTTEQYLAAYPEMDGIAVVGGGGEALGGVQNALKTHNKIGQIVVSTTDFYEGMEADLDSGALTLISGGHWCDPFFSFMLAYNYAAGGFAEGDLPTEVTMDMIYITDPSDAEEFTKWFLGDEYPYTTEEIQQMSITYNENFKLQDIADAAKKLSLQDVIERHGGSA